jgi:bifunctional polynucleotide phosphatase/kinase
LFGDFGAKGSEMIAGFDMDSTLINTKSGKTFAQNADDWVWWNDSVPTKLKKAYEDGYKIVIFSNQAGVSTGKTTSKTLKSKFIQLHKSLKFPFQSLCATESDSNRKPATGMWEYFIKNCNEGVKVNLTKSFYCGDAAGRPKTKTKGKDFSDSDRKFSINVGIEFKTPEMYFLNQKEELPPLGFSMANFKDSEGVHPLHGEEEKGIGSEELEMIIFVGGPGAGKSTFWQTHLKDYVRVNNDTLKTKEKCMKVARETLKSGKSCVIDNTNPDRETRKRYTSIAEELKVPCRCFFFDFEKQICMHNNKQRKINEHRKHLSKKVGDVIIHTFYKKLEKPITDEGFTEVKTVKFVPGPFENDKDKELFYTL